MSNILEPDKMSQAILVHLREEIQKEANAIYEEVSRDANQRFQLKISDIVASTALHISKLVEIETFSNKVVIQVVMPEEE